MVSSLVALAKRYRTWVLRSNTFTLRSPRLLIAFKFHRCRLGHEAALTILRIWQQVTEEWHSWSGVEQGAPGRVAYT